MSLLYAGGLWTIALIGGLLAGYNRVLAGPRWGYFALLAAAAATIAIALFLPNSHLFHIRVAEGLHWWRWALTIAFPVLIYAMLIRWIKRKAEARNDP